MNIRIVGMLVIGLVVTQAPAAGAQRIVQDAPFLVRNVRVFDGERALEHRDVLVADGTVRNVSATGGPVPARATVIDGSGRTLLPGLMDTHVHISDSAAVDLAQGLAFGVTTMFDMFSAGPRFEGIKAIEQLDRADVAAIRSAGLGASAPGGHPSQMGGPPIVTVTDSAESQVFVDARVAEGSDFIKIIYDDLAGMGRSLPRLQRSTLVGLIAAAHVRGKLAVVHAMSEEQSRTALEAGADGLVHLFNDATVSADFAAFVAGHRAFVIPTLTVLHSVCNEPVGPRIMADSLLLPWIRPSRRAMMQRAFGGPAGATCEGARKTVRDLAHAGVPILAGTDAPAPGQTYGASLHLELQLLVRSGLSPLEALATATSAPARAFGLLDRGRVAPGLRADLVLVEGNPAVDIGDTRRIVTVWKRGVVVERKAFGS